MNLNKFDKQQDKTIGSSTEIIHEDLLSNYVQQNRLRYCNGKLTLLFERTYKQLNDLSNDTCARK